MLQPDVEPFQESVFDAASAVAEVIGLVHVRARGQVPGSDPPFHGERVRSRFPVRRKRFELASASGIGRGVDETAHGALDLVTEELASTDRRERRGGAAVPTLVGEFVARQELEGYSRSTIARPASTAPPGPLRALAALFGGAFGKDTVSRVWRKVQGEWEAWNKRPLAGE